MLAKKRFIYHFDWPRLFTVFIGCNSVLVESENDIEVLRMYVLESKVSSRVIIGNSFFDWLKRAFYAYLTVLDRLNVCDITHLNSYSIIGEYIFYINVSNDELEDDFHSWLKDRVLTDGVLKEMFPSL